MSTLEKRCAVCARRSELVKERFVDSGERIGMACNECSGLLWLAFFDKKTGATEEQHNETLELWQRRAAEVAGRPFIAKSSKSDLDVLCERQQLFYLGRLPEGYES